MLGEKLGYKVEETVCFTALFLICS